MKKEELYEEIDDTQNFIQKYLGLSLLKFLIILFLVGLFLVYVYILLNGTNSVKILFGLNNYENYLKSEIVRLKNENAELQREYFELKEISAQ